MSAEPRRHDHRLYWHPQNGWQPDPDGATLRLDAQTRVREFAEARNQLLRPDGRGGWTPVTDERRLSPSERGLVWYGWQTMAAGKPFLAFKGVRVLDQSVAEQLLSGLVVRNEAGEALDNPAAAGHIFLLSVDDARQFHARVKSAGGDIQRGDPLPTAATSAVESMEAAAAELERLAELDDAAVAEARNGDFSGQVAFERRFEAQAQQLERARRARADAERALAPLRLPGRAVAEQAAAESVQARLDNAVQCCGAAHERRESAQRELARLHAEKTGVLPDASPVARALLFRELGVIATESGLEVEPTDTGVRVRTKYGWLRLGPGFNFEN